MRELDVLADVDRGPVGPAKPTSQEASVHVERLETRIGKWDHLGKKGVHPHVAVERRAEPFPILLGELSPALASWVEVRVELRMRVRSADGEDGHEGVDVILVDDGVVLDGIA